MPNIYFPKWTIAAVAILVHIILTFYYIFDSELLQSEWKRPRDGKEREDGLKINKWRGREKWRK